MRASVLVIDDEPAIGIALERLLCGQGYFVEVAEDGPQAIERLQARSFDLVITDLTLEPMDGLQILAWIQERLGTQDTAPDRLGHGAPPVIMITAYGSEKTAVEAMKLGAVDYLPKPFDNDELVLVVRRALEEGRLRRDLDLLREEVSDRYRFHRLIGRSQAMQGVFERIRKVAGTDLTVLIRGPSGTGKELVANAIHYNSPRSARPLIQVNCAAFSRELVESELFGHEQGSFTGATRSRRGKFEVADAGSLFLDEIGDMSLETQAKVLRVLQEKTFERVGGNRTITADVRILAATNQDLEGKIAAGEFRQDLYYRLNVVPVDLPPLQQRVEDIPLLIDHFQDKVSQRLGRPRLELGAEALRALMAHSWPGNVRELEHAIEHAIALASSDQIAVEDLPRGIEGAMPDGIQVDAAGLAGRDYKTAKKLALDSFERQFLGAALRRHGGNITHAAEDLGMYRQQLQSKLTKLRLDAKTFR